VFGHNQRRKHKVIAKCTTYEYWNPWDIMASGNGYTSMYNLINLGWLNSDQIYKPTKSGIIRLIPRSSSLEGFRVFYFEGKDDQVSKIIFSAEYLKKVRGTFDLVGNGIVSGVLLCFSDEDGNLYGNNTLLLREETEKEEQTSYNPLDLQEKPFCDSRNGIKIELLGEYEEGENVYAEVEITLSCPEEKSPTVSVSPEYVQTLSGENIISEIGIGVKNEMALGCGTRTVNIETVLPDANWSATFSPSSILELGPGEAGTITAVIFAPESVFGSYSATFKATDQGSGLSGEASMAIEVLRPPPTPMPTPTPTPAPNKSMTLFVEIDGINVANNDEIVVSKGWIRIEASAGEELSGGLVETLRTKISCRIKNKKGVVKYYEEKEDDYGYFVFKQKRKGQFTVELIFSKEGYRTTSFQTSFKVQ
jgi:hypothetical protein